MGWLYFGLSSHCGGEKQATEKDLSIASGVYASTESSLFWSIMCLPCLSLAPNPQRKLVHHLFMPTSLREKFHSWAWGNDHSCMALVSPWHSSPLTQDIQEWSLPRELLLGEWMSGWVGELIPSCAQGEWLWDGCSHSTYWRNFHHLVPVASS